MLPLHVTFQVQHLSLTVRTLLLGPVHVGLHVEGEAGVQHVFLAKRTEDSGLLPSILATNLHVRDEVMLLHHLMTNVARKHNDSVVGILKMMLDFDHLHILLADGTRGPEEDLRLAVEAPEASLTVGGVKLASVDRSPALDTPVCTLTTTALVLMLLMLILLAMLAWSGLLRMLLVLVTVRDRGTILIKTWRSLSDTDKDIDNLLNTWVSFLVNILGHLETLQSPLIGASDLINDTVDEDV